MNYGENNWNEIFSYDLMWNRVSTDGKYGNNTYNINELNQYTSKFFDNKEENLLYDNNWNLIENESYKFQYDYKNRLVQVIKKEQIVEWNGWNDEGTWSDEDSNDEVISSETTILPEHIIAEFEYDVMGRRVEKTIKDENQDIIKTTTYTYAWQQIIEEISNTQTKEYIYWNAWIDDVIMMINDHQEFFYHKNHLWSIVAITDISANIVVEYSYDAFGKVSIVAWDELFDNSRLFTGREFDIETWLYFFRARYYDPELGRFISRDPIGIEDDINLYAYVGNNPLMFTDPMGTEKKAISQFWNTWASFAPQYDIWWVLGGTALYAYWLYLWDQNIKNAWVEWAFDSGKNLLNFTKKIKKGWEVVKLVDDKVASKIANWHAF